MFNQLQELTKNQLLAKLPHEELKNLLPNLEIVSLAQKQYIIEPNEPLPFVYFPLNSLLSLVTVMKDGSTVECGCIGCEGMTGLPIILDADTTPMEAFTQISGQAVRIRSAIFKEAFDTGGVLQKLLYRYIHTTIVIASQTAACNRLHHLEARMSRWLLMCSDSLESNSLPLTQEFLSTMLGVRRSGVSEAASKLQSKGLIHYQRGHIEILDRKCLETCACECYRKVKTEYNRLFS
ncbi:Crp/Fnr family transcriptional regulator [Fortiea contorta]|uniref:Crp/Fnr family transcriptional regulator n=1 Tax=Fortiea contorta TaxID=1892405 RepID=UPI00037F4A3B|nr:Crp/Fnr family transcriptional regulator [Fortiea contorta]